MSHVEGIGEKLQYAEETSQGSPLVLIITSSAVSANEIGKKLSNMNKVKSLLAACTCSMYCKLQMQRFKPFTGESRPC